MGTLRSQIRHLAQMMLMPLVRLGSCALELHDLTVHTPLEFRP